MSADPAARRGGCKKGGKTFLSCRLFCGDFHIFAPGRKALPGAVKPEPYGRFRRAYANRPTSTGGGAEKASAAPDVLIPSYRLFFRRRKAAVPARAAPDASSSVSHSAIWLLSPVSAEPPPDGA